MRRFLCHVVTDINPVTPINKNAKPSILKKDMKRKDWVRKNLKDELGLLLIKNQAAAKKVLGAVKNTDKK
jgi:hypothetical protein